MIHAQIVNRARIFLLKADGARIDDIADKVGMNRKSVKNPVIFNGYTGLLK